MRKRVIGLALGSGGARGWGHIGALRALEAMGCVPEVVAGASAGALVGAFYAAGRLDALEDFVRSLTPARFARLLDFLGAGGGLVGARKVLELFREHDLPERIEDLPRPFIAIATDLASGREIWLREGSLADAVRASVALPGVISPHRHEGRWLLDGGMSNPVPVSAVRALGADRVIAVNPNGALLEGIWHPAEDQPHALEREVAKLTEARSLPDAVRGWLGEFLGRERRGPRPPSYLEVVDASIDILVERVRRSRLAGDPPSVLVDLRLPGIGVLDFHKAEETIAEGRRQTEAMAPRIRAALGLGG